MEFNLKESQFTMKFSIDNSKHNSKFSILKSGVNKQKFSILNPKNNNVNELDTSSEIDQSINSLIVESNSDIEYKD